MAPHIDYNDPASIRAAAEMLRRHDLGEPEANITSAVRDFLIATRLARSDEIVEENPPSDTSRRAVDLTLDTFVEVKCRTGGRSLVKELMEELYKRYDERYVRKIRNSVDE